MPPTPHATSGSTPVAPAGAQVGDSPRVRWWALPRLLHGSAGPTQTAGPDVPSQLSRDAVALPPPDAVSSILPRTQQRSQDVPQEREVSRYRLALRRMAGDLVSLHQRVTSLEVENGHLRHSLAGRQEPGRALLADGDVDVMTREEVLDRLATLKGELVSSTAEMRQLRDRVQRLQNELIRKNDQEKELVLLQRAHRQQQGALRRCREEMARTKGLEEMVRQQEKVIRVMERMLQEKLSRSAEKPAGEAPAGELHALLLAENRRLREELARPPSPPLPPSTPRPPQNTFGGTEKLSLLAKLEEAQARGRAMERQLEEAARRWAREKQELGTRLLEKDHGFGGSAPRLLHATTLKRPPDLTLPPRRPRTLDPLP
ncbi:coiled-coil domain-containing protein 33 isoform X1 [Gallus gallus]|uniref:coiled-coil domain-containing protein 33 isoform X1 n=1 Tax=Gallus gallus TaxID=9031 RepID=UPI001AE1252A|nr:coiled-coil domain-containing protein 33 isoform X1 [Gallus gallus]